MPQPQAKIVMARSSRLRQEGRDYLAMDVEGRVATGGRGTLQMLPSPHVAVAGVTLNINIVGHDGWEQIGKPPICFPTGKLSSKVEVRA